MAVYVSEYPLPRVNQGGSVPVVEMPELTTQVLTNGGASVQSSAFNAKTKMIRVHTTAVVSVAVGANPTATTNHARLAANATEYFYVTPGDKIAVINNT